MKAPFEEHQAGPQPPSDGLAEAACLAWVLRRRLHVLSTACLDR